MGVQPSTATGSDDATTHFNRAVELHKKGDLAGALTEYRTALRLNPNLVDAHINLGTALHDKGDLAGAITEYRTVLRLNPNHVDAHINLGNALKALGRKADAREEFTKALGFLPDTPANQYKIKQVKQRIRELE